MVRRRRGEGERTWMGGKEELGENAMKICEGVRRREG